MMKKVIEALSELRVNVVNDEYLLQNKIAETLDKKGVLYRKEHQLGKGSRVDFMTEDGVAIEVKKGKPNRARLLSQINRYAEYPEVKAIVIVVETSIRIPIDEFEVGKPCEVFGLQKLWGIAL